MQHIYIVLSQTGTVLSRILKLATGAEYNHSSVSFTPDLELMYSFGRKNAYNPFRGGFVKESPYFGTFRRFKKTRIKILEVEISEEDLAELNDLIERMWRRRGEYGYNTVGLVHAAFRIKIERENRFYCSEFVGYLLRMGNVKGMDEIRGIIQPIHFESLPHREIYRGSLHEYVA